MFRVKIALLSALISGTVLVVFGLFFLTVINRVGMDRIDREILTLGESQLHVRHPRRHWEAFEESLRSIYGPDRWKDLIVQVTGPDNDLLYRSPHWPQDITPALFPRFDASVEPEPAAVAARRGGVQAPPPAAAGQQRLPRPPRPADDAYGAPPPPLLPPVGPPRIKKSYFRTLKTAGGGWRTGIMGNQHITIMIGKDLREFYHEADRYKELFLFAVPLALLLLAAGGWLVAHRALKPVALITRTAENITARGLDQRIPSVSADSELSHLVTVINNMLDRLQKSFDQAVRFSADAAHELQTPLTILQGVLDDAVQHSAPDTEEQRRYGSLLEEVQRLKGIVQKLLILARSDADQLLPRLEPVDLSVMVQSAVEDAEIMGPRMTVEKHIQPGVVIQADPDLIRLVVQELTTNGVKYNTDHGLIRFGLTVQNHTARLTVSNTGVRIPDAERERIFDRFYRIDKSRSDRVAGTGLGLSLAHEIVRAHKGDLRLESATDGLVTFVLSLPCKH